MEFRYDNTARTFDEQLVEDMKEHRKEAEAHKEEREAAKAEARKGGLDAIIEGTPLEQVRRVIDAKKRPAEAVLREHEVGKKMAAMAAERGSSLDRFLTNSKEK